MGINVNGSVPVPADPWSTGIMAVAGVASKAVTPGSAQQTTGAFSSGFDSSGWSVALGGSKATTDAGHVSTPAAAGNQTMILLLIVAAVIFMEKK